MMARKPRGDEQTRKKPRGKEFIITNTGEKVVSNPAPVKTKIKDGTPSIPKKIKDKKQSAETTVTVKEKHQPNQRSTKNKQDPLSHHKERNFLSDSSSVSSTSSSSSEDPNSSHSSGSDDDDQSVRKSFEDSRSQEKATLQNQSSDQSDKDESVTGASIDERISLNETTIQVKKINKPKLPIRQKNTQSNAGATKHNSSERPELSRNINSKAINSKSQASQSIYHGIFTSYQRHVKCEKRDFIRAKNAMSKISLPRIPDPPRNAHIIERNLEVASWSKHIEKLPPIRYDDNVGEDSLSSQSVYHQDIQDKNVLESMIPIERYLPYQTIQDDTELKLTYDILFKAIYEVIKKHNQTSTLKMIHEKQNVIDANIVQVPATMVVHRHDDIEFFDWANANASHSLWFCNDILQSPVLRTAILKAIKKSSHSHIGPTFLEPEEVNLKYHFMGFVASNTKEKKYLVGFHMASFVIFKTDTLGNNTVVVCMLTSRHHILSNMQDRLLQLVQIYQKIQEKIDYQLIIGNEDIGGDIALDDFSRKSYSAMGFDTVTLTQDNATFGVFGIKTEFPIPMMHYGDCLTWSKYARHVLPPTIDRKLITGADKTYRTSMLQLLQTDLYNMKYFNLEIKLQAEIQQHISDHHPEELNDENLASYFDQLFETNSKEVHQFFRYLHKKAVEATVIPLSVFSNLFHERFPKHYYLESTLEILQQFYIAIDDADNEAYRLFPGENYLICIKCTRCHQCISSKSGLSTLLLSAPSAILRHLHILDTHCELADDGNTQASYQSLPLLFSSEDAMSYSKGLFEESVDRNDDMLWLWGQCSCSKYRFEEFKFCEAVKVDVANAREQQTKSRNLGNTISHTILLVKNIFETVAASSEGVRQQSVFPMNDIKDKPETFFYNYNNKTNSGYSFCKYVGRDELSQEDMDSYDLMEAWSLFIHRSVYKSKLAVAREVGRIIYGRDKEIIKPILLGFGYHKKTVEIMSNYVSWRTTNLPKPSEVIGQQLLYDITLQDKALTVGSTAYRPFQYKFGTISNISTIYDRKGENWDKVNPRLYFRSGDPREDNAIQSTMTTSHQYEENIIILQTISQIKKIPTGKNLRKFKLRCYLKNFERGNDSIRTRHKTIFKDVINHYYEFAATNEIIQTLSFDFVDALKGGVWTNLPQTWLKYLREKITQAMDSTIKSIKLFRILGVQSLLPGNDIVTDLPSISQRYIYEVIMDKRRCYVDYGRISDILGDEPWLKSEVHCLCNLSGERTVMLHLGSKRKEKNKQIYHLARNDLVTVANHGNLFQLATILCVNKVDKTAQIKWDVSRKMDTVDIRDLTPYSIGKLSTRKRKGPDFFADNGDAVDSVKKMKLITHYSESKKVAEKEMKYFSHDNQTKLCAEGAIKNILHEINMSEEDIEGFWNLATSPLNIIARHLNCDIPKGVCNAFQQVNAIQKCCWILRAKFRFTTTKKLKLSYFTSGRKCIDIFRLFQFPLVVAVHSRGAIYDHVIVIWNGNVYDYESKYVYRLTEDVIHQICGENTVFRSISTGYGLFPPSDVRALSPHVLDWGDKSYFEKNSKIRKFFTHK